MKKLALLVVPIKEALVIAMKMVGEKGRHQLQVGLLLEGQEEVKVDI